MSEITPVPADPTNADLAASLVEVHQCLEGARDQISAVAAHVVDVVSEQALVRQELNKEIAASQAFREETMRNQELLLRALRIEATPKDDAAPPERKIVGKSVATLSQVGAGWTIAGVVAAALVAAPLAAKIAGAIWAAVSGVLMK